MRIDSCNICVQPLQHMQHSDLYFYNICINQLKHTFETWACNMPKKYPETLETHHRAAMA
jgi:hypothetical protein